MNRRFLKRAGITMGIALAAMMSFTASLRITRIVHAENSSVTQGSLEALDPQGKPRGACPLKHTDVKAEISGFQQRGTEG